MRRPQGGFTVVEALVALLLTGVLVCAAWAVATRQRVALANLADRSELLEAETLTWGVLREELARGRAGRDWKVARSGVLALRAFRGIAIVCGRTPGRPEVVTVRYRGWRLPSPVKDSVVVLGRDARTRAVDLVRVQPGRCPTGSPGFGLPTGGSAATSEGRWHLRPAPGEAPVLLRLFERGSYHLEDGALRYRRGRGGRQPITGTVLDEEAPALWTSGSSGGAWLRFRAARPPKPLVGGARADTGWVRRLGGGDGS